MSLLSRLIAQSTVTFIAAAMLLLIPAGTLNYWEAWVVLGSIFLPMAGFSTYFYKYDRTFVERRMENKEKETEQKRIIRLSLIAVVLALLVPGLDRRFGWTQKLAGGVPLWAEISAQIVALAGYLEAMWSMLVNRFAARTIRVEEGQKVISSGPYGVVRHPMYSGTLVMWMAMPIALGSYIAVPFFALLIPVLMLRLLNEEKVLRKELPGYIDYCKGTRYRLVPYIW
jgi:protein-S-isoprenylcysteine O-methyltransferase Ste14